MNINTKNTEETVRKDDFFMGIKLISTTKGKLLASVRNFISHNRMFYIVTPNPELVLMAQDNLELKSTLNGADLSVPDGVGLKLLNKNLNIIKGREFFMDLITLANRKTWRVFFLGGMGNEARLAKENLEKTFKEVQIEYFPGIKLKNNGEPASEVNRLMQSDAIGKINKFKPHLLFVAFGNPKQEIWIHNNLGRLKIGGAMAVGGTLRYVAGVSKLPPKWMAGSGLEWLWRLITEPNRVKRIINAVIIFPWRVFLSKLH